jgi:hypothetical protein
MANTPNMRLKRWSGLGGPSLINLVEQISSEVVPFFLENGFEHVSQYMQNPRIALSAREMRLERLEGGEIAGIAICFDKYHRPAFQVQVERRLLAGAQEWVRAANIVKRPHQYVCFWGAPWWLPARFWSPAQSRQVAKRLRALSPDMLAFLNGGRRSRHLRITAGPKSG